MVWLILVLVVLGVLVAWFCSPRKENASEGPAQQTVQAAPQSKWSIDSPYDVCYVLAYMAGNVARHDPDERPSQMLVTVDKTAGKTRIYASFSQPVSDSGSVTAYEALGMPKDMAQFLVQIPFQTESSRALSVEFCKAAGTELLKQSMNNGLNALSWKPAMCQVKSYTAQEDNNKIHIDLFAARD